MDIRGVYEFYLDMDKRYKELVKNLIHMTVIFVTVFILQDDSSSIVGYFVHALMGQLFYSLVIEYLIKIY